MNQPSGLRNMLRAAAGALPLVPRGDQLPSRTVTVDELPIDQTNVADYAAVTGLRYGNNVPLTYPFALTFPAMMSLVTGFDFPFAAMGSVHTENRITQYRPIAVTDTVGVQVHAENLREHRKGLLVDLVTDVSVGNDTAWHQVTTFLHQQRTSLSDEPKPPPQKQPKLPPPSTVLRITPGQIRRYAVVGGDHNPIHTNPIAAKLFGFPTVIAHGMFSAAAVLANIEARLPDAVQYSVRFGKPVVLPATAGLYVEERGPARRLGSRVAQYRQGIPASDRHRPGPLAPAAFGPRPATSTFSPCAPHAVSRKTRNSQSGGRASSQTKIAAQIGEPWVTASTPAAPASETAGTCRLRPGQRIDRQHQQRSRRRTGGQRRREHPAGPAGAQEQRRQQRFQNQNHGRRRQRHAAGQADGQDASAVAGQLGPPMRADAHHQPRGGERGDQHPGPHQAGRPRRRHEPVERQSHRQGQRRQYQSVRGQQVRRFPWASPGWADRA